MQVFSCSGTLGDTYTTLCILYRLAKRCEIIRTQMICNHYTKINHWRQCIKDMYSLLPSIDMNFVETRDIQNTRIYSDFKNHKDKGKTLNKERDWCLFPKFVFPRTIELPNKYIVIVPQSGRQEQGRLIPKSRISIITQSLDLPVVVIGNSQYAKKIQGRNIINLTGETSLLEAMGIVASAHRACIFQGLMAMVALSHKIQSDVFVANKTDMAFVTNRLAEQWKPYCNLTRC